MEAKILLISRKKNGDWSKLSPFWITIVQHLTDDKTLTFVPSPQVPLKWFSLLFVTEKYHKVIFEIFLELLSQTVYT